LPCHSLNRRVSHVVVVSGSGQLLRLRSSAQPGRRIPKPLRPLEPAVSIMVFVTDESGSNDKSDRARSALQNLCSECQGWIKCHSTKAIVWSRVSLVIGLPAAILAAVAGVTALASTAGRIPAGILAIASAGLGSAAAFLDSQGRQEKPDRLSRGFRLCLSNVKDV
jgi:hypothetical protein